MKRLILFLCAGLLSSGCASKVFLPGNRFLSPESSGGFAHAEIKTGLIGVTDVQVADDITKTTPDTTPILIKNSAALMALQFGILRRLDLYGNLVFGGPGFGGIKFQLLGDPMKDAKQGNFSLSLAGGGAFGS